VEPSFPQQVAPADHPAGVGPVRVVRPARGVEPRIFPPRLIDALSAEFGRCLLTEGQSVHPDDARRRKDFFTAPAWKGRRQWVAEHPHLAKANAARNVSPPGWCQRMIMKTKALSP
jgi:hypothetical protein